MALKTILNTQSDFTGEFPVQHAKSGLWRFNESDVDEDDCVSDSSGCGRSVYINKWHGTTANLVNGQKGRGLSINTNSPSTEQTYLKIANDGSIFRDIGSRLIVGGWLRPTTYSVGNKYCPIIGTRNGPGNPIFYLSLYNGKPRLMLYDESGDSILDQSVTPPFKLENATWYFIAAVIEPDDKKARYLVGSQKSGEAWISDTLIIKGELNRSCTADIIMGMLQNSYWYAGVFDDWFLDVNSELTAEDLADYFRSSLLANGGDSAADVDALSPDGVTLRKKDGAYPEIGLLYTKAVPCGVSGIGKISTTSETENGVTAVSVIETSTSDDLDVWSDWMAVGSDGRLPSPNGAYIRFRVTLTTMDTSKTPRLIDIRLYDIPKSPYEKIGYARPVVLDRNGAWETVLENAYDIIVSSEINGEDTLSFSLPFGDPKRKDIDNEKKIQIADNVYKIRTITDKKDSNGDAVTSVYAEAEFYDLAFSGRAEEKAFDAADARTAMVYALKNTGWLVGFVTVNTYRTWTNTEKNALSILRNIADLYGGDLVFDSQNRLVHLYRVYGKDSGALFMYGKNLKEIERTIDTTGLVTRLYAVGANGMTFASINDGKEYIEDHTYTEENRVSALDCSSFTNPYEMKEYAEMRMAQYSKPSVSYVLKAMDLSVLTGYEHEAWELGDYVRVEDKDLGVSVTTRIVRREYNLQEPWNTVLELSTKLKNLGNSVSQLDAVADTLDGMGASDINDMVPFNHLRNSRADDGLDYWVNSGFSVDPNNGVSGRCSFVADGKPGKILSISQTVYPANRSCYTISAQIASRDLKKLTETSRVGIEIDIAYEDGGIEKRFIDLF